MSIENRVGRIYVDPFYLFAEETGLLEKVLDYIGFEEIERYGFHRDAPSAGWIVGTSPEFEDSSNLSGDPPKYLLKVNLLPDGKFDVLVEPQFFGFRSQQSA